MDYLSILLAFLVVLGTAAYFVPVVNYYVKFVLIQLGIFVIGGGLFPSAILNLSDPNITILRSAWAGKQFCKMLGIYFEFEGTEHIREGQCYIVLSNHQSSIDVVTIQQLWPYLKKAAPVVKGELRKTGPLAWTLKLCGAVFVDRSTREGTNTVNKAGVEAKATGTSLYIFPEGTRNHNNNYELLPFKKGAFHIAFNSGIPILPVVISKYDFIDRENRIFHRPTKPIVMKVLEPIPTEGLDKETKMNEIIALARDRMTEEFKNL